MKPPLGMSEEEEPPPISPYWSYWMKPPPSMREEERCGAVTAKASYLLHA
jgi:hypothetical protein